MKLFTTCLLFIVSLFTTPCAFAQTDSTMYYKNQLVKKWKIEMSLGFGFGGYDEVDGKICIKLDDNSFTLSPLQHNIHDTIILQLNEDATFSSYNGTKSNNCGVGSYFQSKGTYKLLANNCIALRFESMIISSYRDEDICECNIKMIEYKIIPNGDGFIFKNNEN